ncbi:ArnT family glycosyltransferase [Labilibaculum sp.]|uniref:ArnT family glycosyltransferase n=1 Tax=Labilibaculum sp. TaxID=2060723 RepID=UPI0035656EB8
MNKNILSITNSEKRSLIIYLLTLTCVFAFSYSAIYDSKVDTNGDNAGYYILAKSIATGKGYTNIHKPNESAANHLPPGYPAIVSLVFKTLGYKIGMVKITNGILFLLSIFTLFFLFKDLSGNKQLSFAVSLIVLLNTHFLRFSTMMMSEIPFLLFSSLCLLVFIRLNLKKSPFSNSQFYLFLLLLGASFYIRTAGIALAVGSCAILLFNKNYKYLISTMAGFILLVAPWQIRSHFLGGNSYLQQLVQKNPYRPELGQMDLTDWVQRFLINTKRYLIHEIPNACFPFKEINYHSEINSLNWLMGISILALILFGLFQIKKHRMLLIMYLAANFGILLLWPEVWYGVRFILPIVPILLLLVCLGLLNLSKKLLITFFKRSEKTEALIPYFWTILIVLLCFNQLRMIHIRAKMPYPVNYNNYLFIAKWSKKNTPEEAIFCCRKEQLFYLFSNRKVVRYKSSLQPNEVIEDLIKNKVDYVVLDQLGFLSTRRYLYPAIQKYPQNFQLINHQENPDTYLFKFDPEVKMQSDSLQKQVLI